MKTPKNRQITKFKRPILCEVFIDEENNRGEMRAVSFERHTINIDGVYTFEDGSQRNDLRVSIIGDYDAIPKSYFEFFKRINE